MVDYEMDTGCALEEAEKSQNETIKNQLDKVG